MPCPYRDGSQRALEAAAIRRDIRHYAGGVGNMRRNSGVYSTEPADSMPLPEGGKA